MIVIVVERVGKLFSGELKLIAAVVVFPFTLFKKKLFPSYTGGEIY